MKDPKWLADALASGAATEGPLVNVVAMESGQRNAVRDGPFYPRWVPVPPSTNALFVVSRGRRIKSGEYRKWIDRALHHVRLWSWRDGYPIRVTLTIREKVNAARDVDNFCKPVLDLLVSSGVIAGDSTKYVTDVAVRYRPGTGEGVLIELGRLPDAPPRPCGPSG